MDTILEQAGQPLSRGIAETIAAQPRDPVQYLGLWLERYVQSVEKKQEITTQRDKDTKKQLKKQEAANVQKTNKLQSETNRQKSLEAIKNLSKNPVEIWTQCIRFIQTELKQNSIYVGVVAKKLQLNIQDTLSEEQLQNLEFDSTISTSQFKPFTDAKEQQQQQPNVNRTDDNKSSQEEPTSSQQLQFKYGKNSYIEYWSTSQNQDFLLSDDVLLQRPDTDGQQESGEDENKPVQQVPITFKLLQEKINMIYIDDVLSEPRVIFHRQFPSIGSFLAIAIRDFSGEIKAVVNVDTVLPEGSGQKLSQDEVDLIYDVCQTIQAGMIRIQQKCISNQQQSPGNHSFNSLLEQINSFKGSNYASVQEIKDGDYKDENKEENGNEADTQAAQSEFEDTINPDDPQAQIQSDPNVKKLKGEIYSINRDQHKINREASRASELLNVEILVFNLIKQHLSNNARAMINELLQFYNCPPSTFAIMQALLMILKKPSKKEWKGIYFQITESLFREIDNITYKDPIKLDFWQKVAQYLKYSGTQAQLMKEIPFTGASLVLKFLVCQLYITNKRYEAHKKLVNQNENILKQLDSKQKELEQLLKDIPKQLEQARLEALQKQNEDQDGAQEAA